jgi:hypothetical protein
MKFALVAVATVFASVLVEVPSAFCQTALEIAEDLLQEKPAPKPTEPADEQAEEAAVQEAEEEAPAEPAEESLPAATDEKTEESAAEESAAEEQSTALASAAEETSYSPEEAPGSLAFDMATISMLADESEKGVSDLAKRR